MTSLTDFLLARIAEDESAAKAAAHDGTNWRTTAVYGPIVVIDNGTEIGGDPVVYDEGRPSEEQAAHIAHWDPMRVLAECEAKRRIMEEYVRTSGARGDMEGLEFALLALASIYADHPDYRDEWRL